MRKIITGVLSLSIAAFAVDALAYQKYPSCRGFSVSSCAYITSPFICDHAFMLSTGTGLNTYKGWQCSWDYYSKVPHCSGGVGYKSLRCAAW